MKSEILNLLLVAVALLVSACAGPRDIKTRMPAGISTVGAEASESRIVSVSNAKAFDTSVKFVGSVCSMNSFNLKYADVAAGLLKDQIEAYLAKLGSHSISKVDVDVDEVMTRALAVARSQESIYFDFEIRVGLVASITDRSGAVRSVSVSEQMYWPGAESSSICSMASKTIEPAMPKSLDKVIASLLAKFG